MNLTKSIILKKIKKIDFLKTKLSLLTGNRDFGGVLCDLYRRKCLLVSQPCFEIFSIAWQIRDGTAQDGPWSHHRGDGGEWRTS